MYAMRIKYTVNAKVCDINTHTQIKSLKLQHEFIPILENMILKYSLHTFWKQTCIWISEFENGCVCVLLLSRLHEPLCFWSKMTNRSLRYEDMHVLLRSFWWNVIPSLSSSSFVIMQNCIFAVKQFIALHRKLLLWSFIKI